MEFQTTGKKLLSLAALLAVLCSPILAGTAQVPKPQPAKPQAAKQDSATWLLAGREGECVPLSLLAKKGAELGAIKSPYQLAEKLRADGHQVDLKEFKAGTRPAVEVRAPSAGIHVMFVKSELCGKAASAPKKK